MAWIESHQAIGSHPKTIQLAEVLRIKLPTAVGYLHYLWWWALDYAQDGHIGRFRVSVIAHACHWSGKPETFIKGMVEVGFVDERDGDLVIHDWQDYAGLLLKRRAVDRARKRTERGSPEAVRPDTTRTSNGQATDVKRTSGPRAPARAPALPTNQPDQPTGLVRYEDVQSQARDPDVAAPRAAPVRDENAANGTAPANEPERLPNGAQKCPMCRLVFTGPYSQHDCVKLHPVPDSSVNNLAVKRPSSSKSRRASEATAAEVDAELQALAQRKALMPSDLSADLAAEHERLLALDRQRKAVPPSEPAP